jgi:L,D-transpeptidase ErfK/SrfK
MRSPPFPCAFHGFARAGGTPPAQEVRARSDLMVRFTIRPTRLSLAPARAVLLSWAMLLTFGMAARAQSAPLTPEEPRSGGSGEQRPTALERGKYAVVVDLDTNELHFRQGDVTLWSAPVATGTALRLQSEDGSWDFSTPTGLYQVQYKELDPVWIAPDWFFIENGRPAPPPGSPERRFTGGLGAAAVYIGDGLAIHGTDKPELLGQRVSHGCIRLEDRYALRLFHNVQVGTEIIIVGGEHIERRTVRPAESVNTFTPDQPKPAPKDPMLERWKAMGAEALLGELRTELWLAGVAPEESRWTEVVGLLLRHGLDGDKAALAGLLQATGDLPSRHVELEYATFLADAYARGPISTLAIMAEVDPEVRERAATMIVEATIRLYPGEPSDRVTPWPTRRVPRTFVRGPERRSWQALAEAERAYRQSSARKGSYTQSPGAL